MLAGDVEEEGRQGGWECVALNEAKKEGRKEGRRKVKSERWTGDLYVGGWDPSSEVFAISVVSACRSIMS